MKIINHQMGLTEHYDRLMCTLSTDPQAGIVDVLDKLRTHFDVPTDFLRVRLERFRFHLKIRHLFFHMALKKMKIIIL